jgi:hypothetical protein
MEGGASSPPLTADRLAFRIAPEESGHEGPWPSNKLDLHQPQKDFRVFRISWCPNGGRRFVAAANGISPCIPHCRREKRPRGTVALQETESTPHPKRFSCVSCISWWQRPMEGGASSPSPTAYPPAFRIAAEEIGHEGPWPSNKLNLHTPQKGFRVFRVIRGGHLRWRAALRRRRQRHSAPGDTSWGPHPAPQRAGSPIR